MHFWGTIYRLELAVHSPDSILPSLILTKLYGTSLECPVSVMLLEAIGTGVGHCRVKAVWHLPMLFLLMNHLAQYKKLLSHKSAVFLQMFAVHCFLIPLLSVLPPALHISHFAIYLNSFFRGSFDCKYTGVWDSHYNYVFLHSNH